jgi:hypothetical protein
MAGDIVEQMTDGIEDAQVAVVFITKNYIEKVGGANSTDVPTIALLQNFRTFII